MRHLLPKGAVGAHTKHVQRGTSGGAYDCIACHIKPATVASPGHFGIDSTAEITWGGISNRNGGAQWNIPALTCTMTYCHGNFPGGNAGNAPLWTGTTGQAACGTCHDNGSHPASLDVPRPDSVKIHSYHVGGFGLKCADCHAAVVDAQGNVIADSLHVNGIVDTLITDRTKCNTCHQARTDVCTLCHGGIDNQTGAPPKGLRGETATTQLAVGAHTKHVSGGSISAGFDCTPCHIKPAMVASPGHYGVDSVAEITWGGFANPNGLASWDSNTKTCLNTYCHGNFAGGYGPNDPVWTGLPFSSA